MTCSGDIVFLLLSSQIVLDCVDINLIHSAQRISTGWSSSASVAYRRPHRDLPMQHSTMTSLASFAHVMSSGSISAFRVSGIRPKRSDAPVTPTAAFDSDT